MKTPVTSETLKHHITYSWWKYVLLAILVVFGVNLYYTVTTYKPRKRKRWTCMFTATRTMPP